MLKRNKISGFTMIELLIVMAIIALLSGISVFALQGARSSGRDAKRKADLEDIRSALELYKADCGQYKSGTLPTGTNGLISSVGTDGCTSANTYMQDVSEDPSTGNSYGYNRQTQTTYCLCATLENPPNPPDSCGSVVGNYCVRNP